ncbi:histidine phosphatase superfamily [Apodospora peruviana]|uniref:Histidine phosphatase superfamily n=1 Tax=Apodospora peruviana TaxID=516989 RepID=A0AAE0II75_9PEZI|nr:histidine phosphatase superfamily [Apodospora peruviana]
MAGSTVIHILRHGQSLHNVDRNYPSRDPPLTELGETQAKSVNPIVADLIVISPMTRTLQTALLAFGPGILEDPIRRPEIQIWPDLREAHDAICNKGVSRAELAAKFPMIDFSNCDEEWDYPAHNVEGAVARAERVRSRLKDLSGSYGNIFVVTHRGLVAFLVQGERFDVGECRRYRFAREDEDMDGRRYGVNRDTGLMQDFGPSVLLPLEG